VSIGVVGKGLEISVYDDDRGDIFLNLLDPAERKGRGGPAAPAEGDDAPPPDAPGDGEGAAPAVAVQAEMDTDDRD
jgi:hypothetical protein